jgi:hypothetical protein
MRSTTNKVTLTDRDLATVLASLRHFQNDVNEDQRKEAFPEHFDKQDPLSNEEIDILCIQLNISACVFKIKE